MSVNDLGIKSNPSWVELVIIITSFFVLWFLDQYEKRKMEQTKIKRKKRIT